MLSGFLLNTSSHIVQSMGLARFKTAQSFCRCQGWTSNALEPPGQMAIQPNFQASHNYLRIFCNQVSRNRHVFFLQHFITNQISCWISSCKALASEQLTLTHLIIECSGLIPKFNSTFHLVTRLPSELFPTEIQNSLSDVKNAPEILYWKILFCSSLTKGFSIRRFPASFHVLLNQLTDVGYPQ